MADFRKWLLVLAVAVFAASSAYAQVSCASSASGTQAPLVRDGGLAEIVGDVVMVCTPTPPATSFVDATANWQVFMNGPVTNKFTATNIPGIIVDENTVATVYTGNKVGGNPNSVIFSQVLIPGGTIATVRITNIRIAVPAASGVAGLPTPVQEIVTTSPVSIVPITTPVVIVGYVQPPLDFNIVTCSGGSGGNATFQQCISQPLNPGWLHFAVKFTELFPTAFKPRFPQDTGVEATVPGQVPNNESGLLFTGTNGATTEERATQGTQLKVVFTGIPAGVHILVTAREIGTVGSTQVSSATATAFLVPEDGQDATSTVAKCNGVTVMNNDSVEGNNGVASEPVTLTDITGAGMVALWEVMTQTPAFPGENFIFGVEVKYTAQTSAGLPGLTTAPGGSVSGTLAPTSTNVTASATAPTPRFNIPPIASGAPFAIVPCVTNLLFPYVTNRTNYDTGIALVNTSLDNGTGSTDNPAPFNTQLQHGTCTLYFFPHTAVGVAAVPPQTTRDIPAGDTESFTLGNPPAEFSAGATALFEGYVIARCNFQYAHGFAFIVDGTLPGFGSESYLALIIPDRTGGDRPVDPFTTGGTGTGEQLVH